MLNIQFSTFVLKQKKYKAYFEINILQENNKMT